mgnify:FL=1|jgi:hypothetical protein
MELIKDIAAIVGCISAIIALVTTMFRPVRKKIVNWIKHTSEASETAIAIKDINTKIASLEDSVGDILTRVNKIDSSIKTLDQRVFENERDRIKSELSEYASRCARGLKIYPEEMVHIEEMYAKYSDTLHCNHTGTQNYKIIVNYYKNQDWLKG